MDKIVALFLRYYPQYTHFSLYGTPYRKGGLTLDQVMFLVDSAVKHDRDNQLYLAAIHGIDTKKLMTKEERERKTKKFNPAEPLFGDPEMYANMTEAEKQQATKLINEKIKKTGLPVKIVE